MKRVIKKLLKFLNKKQKKQAVGVMLLMLIAALMDMAGVGMIVPLVTAVTDETFYCTNEWARLACNILHIGSSRQFVNWLLVALIVIFIAKNAYIMWEYAVLQKFLTGNQITLQQQLMEIFIHRPYEYYLNISTGEVIQLIGTDVSRAYTLLSNLMDFVSDGIVCVALAVAVFFIDPLMAGVVSVILGIEMFVIVNAVRKKVQHLGRESRIENKAMNKWLLQAVGGIKDTKVNRKEDFFVEHYVDHSSKKAKNERAFTVLKNSPHLIIEAVTISGVLALLLILSNNGMSLISMIPILSAFVVAAVKILPCANRMTNVINTIPYYENNVDAVLKNLLLIDESEYSGVTYEMPADFDDVPDLTFNDCCELSNISFHYPNVEKYVLDGASMKIPFGASVGVVGPSGAGKTTAIDILLGLLHSQKGEVLCDGTDIRAHYGQWLEKLSYIPQSIYLIDDTIAANVAYGVDKGDFDEAKIRHALAEAQLLEFVDSSPDGIYTKIGERGIRLSGGQRQRIGIARALYTDPEILIFDEATASLDNETEAAIMEGINALHGKKTLVIIAHRLTTIEGCDMVYRVENGKIERER